jgi:2-enoate reductase
MERESSLGGTVAALAMDPLSMEFQNFIDYLGVMLRKNKVDVRVCKEAGPADIEEINPDAIIVATGASMRMPDMTKGLPGVMDHVTALKNRREIGRKVVVWGLMYGAELAISLAEEGKEVVLIGEGGETGLASHASNSRKFWIIRRLSDFNLVRVTPEANKPSNLSTYFNMKVEEVSVDSVSIATRRGKKKTIPFDTLIISRGREKNDTLAKELEGKAPEVHVIGDCAAAGNIHKAVFSANEVARKL